MKLENLAKGDWTDPDKIRGLVESYSKRYGNPFWDGLLTLTSDEPRNSIADFGCGPGLFLVDAVEKFRAKTVYGFDQSVEMLQQALEFLEKRLPSNRRILEQLDFDKAPIPLADRSIDLAFSGFFLHEIEDPLGHVDQVLALLRVGGAYAVYDYVSSDEEEFVLAMAAAGMREERARKRYPHMCKHSIDDIKALLTNAGFQNVRATKVAEARAVVVGFHSTSPGHSSRHDKHLRSPWAHDDSELSCPRCGESKAVRIHDSWGRSRGVQMFECESCGKRFYERGIDDFRPTFVR